MPNLFQEYCMSWGWVQRFPGVSSVVDWKFKQCDCKSNDLHLIDDCPVAIKKYFSFSAPTLYWDNLNKCCKWDNSSNMMRLSQTQSETDKRFYFQQMNDTISNKRCSSCLPRFQSPLQFPVILTISSNCFSSHGWRVFVHTSETFCLSYIFQVVSWVVVGHPFRIFFLVSSCPVLWKSFF